MAAKKTSTKSKYNLQEWHLVRDIVCNLCSDIYGPSCCDNCMMTILNDEMNVRAHREDLITESSEN